MAILSDEIIELIDRYVKVYGEKPEPFWYTEWNSQEEYKNYLEKELGKKVRKKDVDR